MLLSLLVAVLILGLIVWVIQTIPLPEPFRMIALVIVAIVAVLWLVSYLPGAGLAYCANRILC